MAQALVTAVSRDLSALSLIPNLPTLFHRYQLGRCFPASQEEYKAMHERASQDPAYKKAIAAYVIQCLYSCNAKPTIDVYFRGKTEEQVKQSINKGDPQHGLSCLHITVIQGNIEGVRDLIAKGALVNAQDKYGFTPWLHTALLTDFAALKHLLEQHGATKDEPRWRKLRRDSGLEQSETCSLEKSFYRDEKGDLQQLSLDPAFLQTTLSIRNFTDGVIYRDHALLWQHGSSGKPITIDFLDRASLLICKDWREKIPKLYVANDPELSRLRDNPRSRALYTLDSLPAGHPIGRYSGTAVPSKDSPGFQQLMLQPLESPYSLNYNEFINIDPEKEGNLLRFANDGFPVITFVALKEQELVGFTLQPVAAHTLVTWDYELGFPQLKWGNYILTKRQEIDQYFQQATPLQMWRQSVELMEQLVREKIPLQLMSKFIRYQEVHAKLRFVLHTPACLIYLCLRKPKETVKWIKLVQDKKLQDQFFQQDFQHYTWVGQTLFILDKLDETLNRIATKDHILSQQVKAYILDDMLSGLKMTQVVHGMYQINLWLVTRLDMLHKDSLDSAIAAIKRDWPIYLQTLKPSLESFSWYKDPESPLAIEVNGSYRYKYAAVKPLLESMRLN